MPRPKSTSCCVCQLPKEGNESKFANDRNSHDGLRGTCRKCHAEYIREYNKRPENVGKRREVWYMWKYGLTLDDYDNLLELQEGTCAVCKTETPGGKGRFHVDHNHHTGKIRGLLCCKCNLMLGYGNDNPQTLRNAIKYLEK